MNHVLLVRRILVLTALMTCVCIGAAIAQDSKPQPQGTPTPEAEDISGMYSFQRDGEFVQIEQHPDGRITGFVSRYGETDTDDKTFLDQFFKSGSLKGNQLDFATRVIHGTWFEFSGTISHGPGKTPADEAYRIIKGKLVRHRADENNRDHTESREITLKSFPSDMEDY